MCASCTLCHANTHTPHDELELFPERKLLSGQTGNYELAHRRWPAAIIQTQSCSHNRIHSLVPSSLSSVALNTKNGTFRFSRFRSQNKNKKCLAQNDSILFRHSLYFDTILVACSHAGVSGSGVSERVCIILGILLRCHALNKMVCEMELRLSWAFFNYELWQMRPP